MTSFELKNIGKLLQNDKFLYNVDENKLMNKMNLQSENVNKESLSRYYAFHKLKSDLTKS